ncbi:MAG: hypothetical protein HYX39_01520 [Bacteroidetes bacterium]|nr:hypothetical protein [Bacteroidota bacterium]
MKQLFLYLFFITGVLKSQCIFIYAAEKIKTAEIPLTKTDFTVTINDTLKLVRSSDNDGSLGRISVEKGKYNIKIKSAGFSDGFQNEVVVNESRTTDVTIILTRKPTIKKEK